MLPSMASDRRRFENPPLIEAVVEFQFHPNPEWDSTYLGLIRRELSDFPELETMRGATVVMNADHVGLQHAPEGKRFWRHDRSAAITITPETVAASVLPPKLSSPHEWTVLRDIAFGALKVYQTIAVPPPIRQSSVRYINSVSINPEEFRASDWLSGSSGLIPDVLMKEGNPFSVRLERVAKATDKYQTREVVVIAAQPLALGEGRLLVDIDEVTIWLEKPELRDLRLVSENMHDAVHEVFGRVFESSVTETFGLVQSTKKGV